MILAYCLVVASLVVATLTGYVVAALFRGVEVGIIAFALGMAWAVEAWPWLERRVRE